MKQSGLSRLMSLFVVLIPSVMMAQVTDEPSAPEAVSGSADGNPAAVFTIVDQMPQFPGGEAALYKYLNDEILFPKQATEAGVGGTVYTTFVVQEDGSLKDHKILRGVNEWLDAEALRVITAMPRWEPGKYQGRLCCVQFNLPIKFTIVQPRKELVIKSPPSFPGGDLAMKDFIGLKLSLKSNAFVFDQEGTVVISFVVELDGSLSDAKVMQSLREDVDSVALGIVRSMPNWKPAICQESPCRAQFEVPFSFGAPPQLTDTADGTMPSFPGGEGELFTFMGKNTIYPMSAADDGISGTVYLTFQVDTDGSLKNIRVSQGVREDLDNAAIKMVNKMPLWIPAMKDGQSVQMQYELPVRFTMR